MTNLPTSHAAAALYGLGIEAELPDFMEEYERHEDAQRAAEEIEAEAGGDPAAAPDFTYPCPLRELLA